MEEEIKLDKQYRQTHAAIERLVALQQYIMDSAADRVIINVMDTTHIAPGLLPLLAVLPNFSRIYHKAIGIRYSQQNLKLTQLLNDSGVLAYYNNKNSNDKIEQDGISFRRTNDISEYAALVKRIMELAPVQFNEKSYSNMFSKLYEIFINAATHGKNELGTYTYGTLDSNGFVFTIYDVGVGIAQNVNTFLKSDYSGKQAMEWALTMGNSTSVTDYPRGAGFSLLETFVYKNSGKITLCSDDVICIMQDGVRRFWHMKNRIRGTLFIMNIKVDSEYIYDLDKEMA